MNLTIISAQYTKSFDINWLEINTTTGNRVILDNHAPLITFLQPGQPIKWQDSEGHENILIITNASLHIERNKATLILYN